MEWVSDTAKLSTVVVRVSEMVWGGPRGQTEFQFKLELGLTPKSPVEIA